jgi:hypothetical protein
MICFLASAVSSDPTIAPVIVLPAGAVTPAMKPQLVYGYHAFIQCAASASN